MTYITDGRSPLCFSTSGDSAKGCKLRERAMPYVSINAPSAMYARISLQTHTVGTTGRIEATLEAERGDRRRQDRDRQRQREAENEASEDTIKASGYCVLPST